MVLRRRSSSRLLSQLLLLAALVLQSARGDTCPSDGCPDLREQHDIDLSPLRGVWEAVYYTQTEGSTVADVPHFFNISLCSAISPRDQCSDSRVCYSDHMDTFYNLGMDNSCKYSYTNRTIQFTYEFSPGANFGQGNTTVTLICGRTLGVPEVIEGSPSSHAIQIVWVTSAACKRSTSLAANTLENKCYHIHPYEDNGLKAKFIDLTELIRPHGYTVTYSERAQAKILLSICRPLEISQDSPHASCNGSMACLIESDPQLSSSLSTPFVLGSGVGAESNLHMHGNFLTTIYSTSGCSEDGGPGNRTVMIHYICPSENQDLGPHITYADDKLCRVEISWYTSFACGSLAIQSTGCSLTTEQGLQFDLTGLEAVLNVTGDPSQRDSSGQPYRYKMRICGSQGLNQLCDARDSDDLVTHVAQFDSDNRCWSLGGGEGKLRYADGSLTLTYTMGDSCHTNFKRTSVITFVCPDNIQRNGSTAVQTTSPVTFIGETDCFYRFEWVTDLACGAETSGESSCEFELSSGSYSFAPLVGTNDENWVAIDDDPQTTCFMVHPCGELHVTDESSSDFCNIKKAPKACTGASVCQIFTNGSAIPIGKFNLQNASTIESADPHILSVRGRQDSTHIALIHYVCKTGDLTSPPVFIGKTNNVFYEFHWTTYAACPSGIQPGQSCAVSHKSSGFTFDLSSMKRLTYETSDYTYEVGICSVLRNNETKCTDGDKVGSSSCQTVHSGGHYSLGKFNDTLIYEDGTLKLHYYNGTRCNHKDKPFRSSTLLFVCDSTAHTPTINDITEDYCDYAIDIRTKEACPPAFRTMECVHFSGDKTFDFSELSRTLGGGNWETRGRDGSVYYINVCQPLNRAKGCSPLAAVCRAKTDITKQRTVYTNLGLASTAKFSHTTNGEGGKMTSINLEYKYKNPDGSSSACPEVTTIISFVCNTSTLNTETGPHFVSGGDEANPCQYTFTWQTVAACPIQPKKSKSCQVSSSNGFNFDLSPLSSTNVTVASETDGFTFNLALCGALGQPCNKSSDVGTVAVCQTDSIGQHHVCGKNATQLFQYFDGSLSLKYTDGDSCHHVKANRSVLINFECDRTLNDAQGSPRYVREKDCQYTFEWPTALACEPQEVDCVAAGGKYDLRALLERKTWRVDKGEVKDDYEYVIGGCNSLDFRDLKKCPQRPGMGACRYSNIREVSGEALGYMTGNIVEEASGSLRLTYSSGDRCGSGRARTVHVEFRCEENAGAGVPALVSVDDTNCLIRISWITQYACSHDSKSNANKEWIIKDDTTGQEFDLTQLKSSVLTRLYHEGDTAYNYSIGLNSKSVSCPRATKTSGRVGACQTNIDTGKMHALGFIGSNTTLDYIDGQLRVEYMGGDDCHHVVKSRKAVVTFECDKSGEGEFLQVLPEAECEYSFVVHTEIACPESGGIGLECLLDGYEDLAGLVQMKVPPVIINDTHKMYVSVCSPLSETNQQDYHAVKDCPSSSGACIVDKNTHKVVNLGKPSSQRPLKELKGASGVEIEYIEGGMCVMNGTHEIRYTTKLLLICNRNVPIGVPELVAKEEQDCEYIVRWETKFACHYDLPTSKISKDICTIKDTSLSFSYNFTNLAKHATLSAIDTATGTTYYIQLCGTTSGPLPSDAAGCSQSDTGICRRKSNGETKSIVAAEHKFAMTSHTPHVIDVYYSSGEACDSDPSRKWSAFLTLQCTRGESETAQPVFQPEEDKCELHFVWQNSSFCVGVEACSVEGKQDKHVYNLDGLLSQTWTGLIVGPDEQTKSKEKGGSFSMSICRNLNPFSTSGVHCSSPSGICLHTPDGGHVNLGSLHSSLNISYYRGDEPVVHAMYRDGDVCPFNNGARRYQTDLFIYCAKELSTPLLSVHEDSRQGNCSWSAVINTPLACPPGKTFSGNDSSCNKTISAGTYTLPSYARKSSEFTDNLGNSYTVTLCGSSGRIVQNTNDKSLNLGNFQAMVVSATTNGPRLVFNGGDSCPLGRNQRYGSYIFMECNRTADPADKKLTLQQDLSYGCQKFFFWSTPYACLSEQVSCSLSIEKGNLFFDFSPLHSDRKPWKVQHDHEAYFINICGAIGHREAFGLFDCGPDAAVCLRTRNGVEEIATAGTQQITYTGDGENVQLQFTGPVSRKCSGAHSHVTIHMVCGIQGLTFDSVSSCNHHFTWSSPYACKASDSHLTTYKSCPDTISGSQNFDFYPKKLSGSYVTTDERGVTYHVNLCDAADTCDDGISVCFEERRTKTSVASFKNQIIMADGYQLLFHMSMLGEGKSHAIVRVVCLTADNPDDHQPNTLEFENYAEVDSHKYFHFTIYTNDGCHFNAPSEPPSSNNNGGKNNNGGNNHEESGGKKRSKNGTVAAVLISMTVVIIIIVLLVFTLYKKERREYVQKALVSFALGKSDETVVYHRVSTFEMDEETALMDDRSGEDSAEVSESEIDKKSKEDKDESDEELINL